MEAGPVRYPQMQVLSPTRLPSSRDLMRASFSSVPRGNHAQVHDSIQFIRRRPRLKALLESRGIEPLTGSETIEATNIPLSVMECPIWPPAIHPSFQPSRVQLWGATATGQRCRHSRQLGSAGLQCSQRVNLIDRDTMRHSMAHSSRRFHAVEICLQSHPYQGTWDGYGQA